MHTKWTEHAIREELAKLDKKTGLCGAKLPIRLNRAKNTLGSFSSADGGSFQFSNYYFQDPNWPVEEALDTIRHEYAHYMEFTLYGHGGHGPTWKLCCDEIGAVPVRCYNAERAEHYRQKHLEEEKLSQHYDTYKVGDQIEHPRFGTGVIIDIFGESITRGVTIAFAEDVGIKKLGLAWVDTHCKKCAKQ